MTRIGVVTFPGSLDDRDALAAVAHCGAEGVSLWHGSADLDGVDAIVLPGGFSYGDYLRCGAVAHRAAIMESVAGFAAGGGPVLGICNGFQILCEAGLLPGALLRNAGLRFVSRTVPVRVDGRSAWTATLRMGTELKLPVKNGEGRYHVDAATLDLLEVDSRIVLRYQRGHNPNGSVRDIAGICNGDRNVVGMMPHPEHAVDPLLACGTDGRGFFESVMEHLSAAPRG